MGGARAICKVLFLSQGIRTPCKVGFKYIFFLELLGRDNCWGVCLWGVCVQQGGGEGLQQQQPAVLSPPLKEKGREQVSSPLEKDPPKAGSRGGGPSRPTPGLDRPKGGPRCFPKAPQKQGRGGKKGIRFGQAPGELLKRGLRVGGGASTPLSLAWAEGMAVPERPQGGRDTGPGAGTLTAAPGRRS